jgi:hypothetical protein
VTTATPTAERHEVPAGLYLGLAIGMVGTIVYSLALATADGAGLDRYGETERWRLFELGCWFVQHCMTTLGLFALSRHSRPGSRALIRVAACLLAATLLYMLVNIATTVLGEYGLASGTLYMVVRLVIGGLTLVGAVLLTIGADAWRRAPIAAVVFVLIPATGSWLPGTRRIVGSLLGDSQLAEALYGIVRQAPIAASLSVIWAGVGLRVTDSVKVSVRAAR